MGSLELWGGVECTVNRVGAEYFDQVERSGHRDRIDDIERFAEIGVRALRYPVLWEHVASTSLVNPSWEWTDERLDRIRETGLRPIATLLHHGSGPPYTNLLDPAFAESLAAYAALVAARYPWITDFTPVNEPLTTARFSALYGHWYPHRRDDRAFVRAFLNQMRGIVRAMERITEFVPAARLIATEDVGRVTSTPELTYQAEFENHRRWLTFDLLCGCVDENHPLWSWFIYCGTSPDELRWFRDHPWPPSIVGLNYYLTSDRHLDGRLDRYPRSQWGGNGRDPYVDVDAVRVVNNQAPSHFRVLEEAWLRYRRPLALTEVHAGCTREEQMRWLARAWSDAQAVRGAGADVRAVTTWALLGSYDWNTLVTCARGVYEPGAFDVRSDPPRLTAIGHLASALSRDASVDPLAHQPGWWERCDQPLRRPVRLTRRRVLADHPIRPILILGAGGLVGSHFARACVSRGLPAIAASHAELDALDRSAIMRAMFRLQPWAVINAVGDAHVDAAENDPQNSLRLNTTTAEIVACAAKRFRARLLSFSTDLVFDGLTSQPYTEHDIPAPCNIYGRTKLLAEESITGTYPAALIVRTSPLFAAGDPNNYLSLVLRELSGGREVVTADDLVVSPTYVPHLVDRALDLLIDGESGIWHLANRSAVSWTTFARWAARLAGLNETLVASVHSSRLGLLALRPPFAALRSVRGALMPTLEEALVEYFGAGTSWRERRQEVRHV